MCRRPDYYGTDNITFAPVIATVVIVVALSLFLLPPFIVFIIVVVVAIDVRCAHGIIAGGDFREKRAFPVAIFYDTTT
jgi:hypothetical protein